MAHRAPRAMSARRTPWLRTLLRSPNGLFGVVVAAIVLLAAALSLVWTPYDPVAVDVPGAWRPPGAEHPLGTDNVGRDMLSVLLVGARVTVVVAIGSAIVAAIVGVLLATLGALTARWVREPVAVLIDILVAFPTLLIAMMLAAAFGASLLVVFIAVGIGFGVNMARVTRPEIRRVAQSDFVLAGRAAGLGPLRNITRHVLPNIAPIVIVQLSWAAAVAVLAEAGLSYLGYGAPSTTLSWGRMLADLQGYIGVHPLTVLWPGLAITITVLGLNLLGDGLRDATDPRLARGDSVTRAALTREPVQL